MSRKDRDQDAPPPIPTSSLILGYGPVLALPVAALFVYFGPGLRPQVVLWLAIWWAASILTFLAGVKRGLTFCTDAPPRKRDLAVTIWLFALGAGAVAAALGTGRPLLPLTMLILGYATVAIVDPIAARVGLAPAYFERLRPPQMGIALLGLIALLIERISMAVPV